MDVCSLESLWKQVPDKTSILAGVVLCVTKDEMALHAQVRSCCSCGTTVIGLNAAYGDDAVMAVGQGFGHEEL